MNTDVPPSLPSNLPSSLPSNLPPSLPSNLPPPPPKQSNDALATTSMVLGIIGLIPGASLFLAVPAIICGIIALNRISKSKGILLGKNRAITGLATAGIGILMLPFIAIFLAMLLPALQKAKEKALLSNCRGNIKQIEMICWQYAGENQDLLPPSLEALQKTGLLSKELLTCPCNNRAADPQKPNYLYFGAGCNLTNMDYKTILITESDRFHGKRYLVIGFGDGHVEVVDVDPASDLPSVARERGWNIPGTPKE